MRLRFLFALLLITSPAFAHASDDSEVSCEDVYVSTPQLKANVSELLQTRDVKIPLPPGFWGKTFSGMKVGARAIEVRPEELHSETLNAESEETVLFNLVRYTGYVPEMVARKKIVGEHEMAVAYPFHIGNEVWRLVVEYKYVPAVTANPDYEGVVPKAVPAMLKVEEVVLASPDATLTEAMVLMTRKAPTIMVVNGNSKPRLADAEDLINKYWQRAEKVAKGEGKHKKEVVEGSLRELLDLVQRIETNGSSDSQRLLHEIQILGQPIAASEPIVAENLPQLSDKLLPFTVYSKVTGDIIEKYRAFMAAYLFTANRNSLARPLETLQGLRTIEQFRALTRSIKYENIRSTLYERSIRQTLGAPAGVAIGAVVATITTAVMSAWTHNTPTHVPSHPDPIRTPVVSIEETSERPVEVRFHKQDEIQFVVLTNQNLVPLNPYLPLWQQNRVSLEDEAGVSHTYEIERHMRGDGDVSVILTRT